MPRAHRLTVDDERLLELPTRVRVSPLVAQHVSERLTADRHLAVLRTECLGVQVDRALERFHGVGRSPDTAQDQTALVGERRNDRDVAHGGGGSVCATDRFHGFISAAIVWMSVGYGMR